MRVKITPLLHVNRHFMLLFFLFYTNLDKRILSHTCSRVWSKRALFWYKHKFPNISTYPSHSIFAEEKTTKYARIQHKWSKFSPLFCPPHKGDYLAVDDEEWRNAIPHTSVLINESISKLVIRSGVRVKYVWREIQLIQRLICLQTE